MRLKKEGWKEGSEIERWRRRTAEGWGKLPQFLITWS